MTKVCKWLMKAFISGIISFAIVSIVCFFYYNLPIHYSTSTGATDYSWTPNDISFRGTEGFSFNKTDKNGYINNFPYTKDTPDILVMGSSHTEGFNVNYRENFTYVLNQKFYDNKIDLYAYNIGTSGHTIERCFNNLNNAINTFQPSQYVIIETYKINPSIDQLKNLYNGTYEKLHSYNSGIVYFLQKFDFVRLAYTQLSNAFTSENEDEVAKVISTDETCIPSDYKYYLEQMISKGNSIVQNNNCKLIIIYSPFLNVDYNGNVETPNDLEYVNLFRDICHEYNITFIDMQIPYEEMYKNAHILPHGFSNTAVGTGHMNKYAHNCISNKIFEYIQGELKK